MQRNTVELVFRYKPLDYDRFCQTNQLKYLNHCCFSGFPDYNTEAPAYLIPHFIQ